ncbi:hypothetical protein, partial [Mesorhizobium sp. M1329]|uniref:hypothetical protein n=1 Tax=Mesorhizobium sp. M1329 TaxID=2957083 RepID=UPI00333D55A0
KAGNGSRSFAQLPLQRILSQPKLNPKIAICDSPGHYTGRNARQDNAGRRKRPKITLPDNTTDGNMVSE